MEPVPVDGTAARGKFVVTYESIIPNLSALRGYEPLLAHFWKDGLFGDRGRRYFRLVHRGEASPEDVDTAMTLGTNYPRGPIAWGREIGYPVVADQLAALERAYPGGRYRPSPALAGGGAR